MVFHCGKALLVESFFFLWKSYPDAKAQGAAASPRETGRKRHETCTLRLFLLSKVQTTTGKKRSAQNARRALSGARMAALPRRKGARGGSIPTGNGAEKARNLHPTAFSSFGGTNYHREKKKRSGRKNEHGEKHKSFLPLLDLPRWHDLSPVYGQKPDRGSLLPLNGTFRELQLSGQAHFYTFAEEERASGERPIF